MIDVEMFNRSAVFNTICCSHNSHSFHAGRIGTQARDLIVITLIH